MQYQIHPPNLNKRNKNNIFPEKYHLELNKSTLNFKSEWTNTIHELEFHEVILKDIPSTQINDNPYPYPKPTIDFDMKPIYPYDLEKEREKERENQKKRIEQERIEKDRLEKETTAAMEKIIAQIQLKQSSWKKK